MPLGLVAVRALHFWSVAILFGGGGLLRLIGARVEGGGLVLRLASIAAAVTGLGWFVFTFANVTGGFDRLGQTQDWHEFIASPFGPPWVAQLALAGVALALGAWSARRMPFVIAGLAFAVDQAWLGHAATGTGALGVTLVVSYVAHTLAGFAWVGALTMLCATLRSPEALRDALPLFATLGLFVVATILASGCLNAAFHMTSFATLVTTSYGGIVSVKAALFTAMLALALHNRREGRRDRRDTRGLALGVAFETLLGLVVLCAAAVLGITAPPS